MSDQFTYAKFWRCALQVNPVGYNSSYRGKEHNLDEESYNKALLDECRKLDVKVIGVADHGNVSSIKSLRELMVPHGIIVFPGFEVSSNDKVHYVCLFPEDTSEPQLQNYLGRLRIDPKDGTNPSQLSSDELIEEVDKLGGFIYAAHCTSASGLLKSRLPHIWKNEKLRAVQIPTSIEDLSRDADGEFYKNVILNKNTEYRRKKNIAVINARDIACPTDMEDPGASCLIKMTKPCFSAFKMAFLDPESRIRLNSAKTTESIGRILNVSVTGGFLDNLQADFSDHLNTVIGGRGTGKSTLLECIRYALNLTPKGEQARSLHDSIIKENLGETGKIELTVFSSHQHNKVYRVSRRNYEEPVVLDLNGEVSSLSPEDLLPEIEVYGQNEIYELAINKSNQLQLLSRFLPKDNEYKKTEAELLSRLKNNQDQLIKLISELDELQGKVDSLPHLEERRRNIEESGLKDKLKLTSKFSREQTIAAYITRKSKELSDFLTNQQLPSLEVNIDLSELPNASDLKSMLDILEDIHREFDNNLAKMKEILDEKLGILSSHHRTWDSKNKANESELKEMLSQFPDISGKKTDQILSDYNTLTSQIEEISLLEPSRVEVESEYNRLNVERAKLLSDLSNLRNEHLKDLKSAARKISKKLTGKLKVEIIENSDRTPLIDFLKICGLEGVGERRLSFIKQVDKISPSELSETIKKGQSALTAKWGLTKLVAETLAKLQISRILEMETLSFNHEICISLNVAHGNGKPNFRPLNKLSTGQQCTAILHLLLLENNDPLLIDQPEDNLDNAFIAERIVSELRKAKTKRQFLFATHNANIPVFGDAEWIGVFSADENHERLGLRHQGSIDVPEIKEWVTKILEGGRDAFIQRKEKYNF